MGHVDLFRKITPKESDQLEKFRFRFSLQLNTINTQIDKMKVHKICGRVFYVFSYLASWISSETRFIHEIIAHFKNDKKEYFFSFNVSESEQSRMNKLFLSKKNLGTFIILLYSFSYMYVLFDKTIMNNDCRNICNYNSGYR